MKKILLLILFTISNITTFAQNAADIDLTNLGFNGVIKTTVIQPDGKILVGGEFTTFNGVTQNCLIRLNIDGTKDNSFNIGNGFTGIIATQNPNPPHVSVITLQSDGKILIGGNFRYFNDYNSRRIVRLNSDGTRDVSFSSGISGFDGLSSNIGIVMINAITLQADGKILVGGNYDGYAGMSQKYLVRLNTDGARDTTFNTGGTGPNGTITCIGIAPNGHIFVGGQFTAYNGSDWGYPNMIQLKPNGDRLTIYNSFLPSTFIPKTIKVLDSYVYDSTYNINLYEILVGGDNAPYFAKLYHSGGVYTTFTGQFNNNVSSLKLKSDGKILVCGDFTTFDGASKNRMVSLNSDYSLDTNFDIGTGFEGGIVSCLDVQDDGKIWAGGSFTTYKGVSAQYSLRLKGETALSTINFSKNNITLYPNPVKDILNISLLENTNIESYEIYDLLGKKILSKSTIQNFINLNELSNGVYIVKVATSEGVLSTKFIKE